MIDNYLRQQNTLANWRMRNAIERERETYRTERAARFGETTGTTGGTGSVSDGSRSALPSIPEFEAPEYDTSKVAAKAQKIAAPRVRQLRETVRAAQAQPYENPNVKRMTVGQALQGYGTGLESVMAGARRGAVAEYGQEYGKEFTAAQMNFQTQVQTQMAQYGNLWTEYLTNLKSNLSNQGQVGIGVRSDPNYQSPTGLPPGDPNDPNMIGGRQIWRG